jgi:hypothetical protein
LCGVDVLWMWNGLYRCTVMCKKKLFLQAKKSLQGSRGSWETKCVRLLHRNNRCFDHSLHRKPAPWRCLRNVTLIKTCLCVCGILRITESILACTRTCVWGKHSRWVSFRETLLTLTRRTQEKTAEGGRITNKTIATALNQSSSIEGRLVWWAGACFANSLSLGWWTNARRDIYFLCWWLNKYDDVCDDWKRNTTNQCACV